MEMLLKLNLAGVVLCRARDTTGIGLPRMLRSNLRESMASILAGIVMRGVSALIASCQERCPETALAQLKRPKI